MPILEVYVTSETLAGLEDASRELDRDVSELAEAAVAEAVVGYSRLRPATEGVRD